MEVEHWSSMKDVCEFLGASHDSVCNWIRDNQLPAYRTGRLWKFKLSEVRQWAMSEHAANTKVGRNIPLQNELSKSKNETELKGANDVSKNVTSFKPLFKLLIDRGMKKKELAEKADISIATVTKMGKVGNNVSVLVLEKICRALDCKLNDVVELVSIERDGEIVINGVYEKPTEEIIIPPVELNQEAVEEYKLTPTEEDIVHFIYERLGYYRENPPAFMVNQARRDYGIYSIEEAKRSIPTDRFYSLVLNEVLEGWKKEGNIFLQKHIPLKLIESGYFELEEGFGDITMQ